LILAASKVFKAPFVLCARKREKDSFETHLLQDTSLPQLILFSSTPLIWTLLVSRNVTTQAPSNNNNNTSKRNSRIPSQKNLPLSTLSNKK